MDLLRKIRNLQGLLARIVPVPLAAEAVTGPDGSMPVLECRDYRTLVTAWRKAMRWRQDMDDVLSVMLAVCLSTEQVGDQLFLKVIGDAGGGKTRFCDAILVSKFCYPLEHLTGFHSGYKGEKDDKDDYSLVARINKKTLVTPEGDVLMSSPRFAEIMSQQRRIFDGTTGASYKNRKEDMRYTGLRTPWIMAGTPALVDTDQSRLGDRFLRVYLSSPDEEEKDAILRRVGHTALRSVLQTSDGRPETQLDAAMATAYRFTGGYVDYLRNNAADLLSQVEVDEHRVVDYCTVLAEFTAYLRARPNMDRNSTGEGDAKEVPTRLTHQYVRLACCLAAVLNRPEIDRVVLRRVRKVAIDTASGVTLKMAKVMHESGRGQKLRGVESRALATLCNYPEDRTRTLIRFLKTIGAIETVSLPGTRITQTKRYVLSRKLSHFYEQVMGSGS